MKNNIIFVTVTRSCYTLSYTHTVVIHTQLLYTLSCYTHTSTIIMTEHTICVAILKGKVAKQCSARAKPGFAFCGRHLACYTEKKISDKKFSSKAELDKSVTEKSVTEKSASVKKTSTKKTSTEKVSVKKPELDEPQYSTFDMDQLYKALVDARREDAFGEKSLRIQEMIVQRASAC